MSRLSREEIIRPDNGTHSGWMSLPAIGLVNQVANTIDSGLALNAMPTPFARAEVVREAFEAVGGNFETAGEAYRHIVSDTLDVLEILYNYNLYSDCIKIYKRNLNNLQFPSITMKGANGANADVSYLADALKLYCAKDDQNNPLDMYVITYVQGANEYAIAMSCPETLFFTTSRLDRKQVSGANQKTNDWGITIPRRNGVGNLFGEPLGLTKRNESFQNYLLHLYRTNVNTLGTTAIGNFIASTFGAQRQDNFDATTVDQIMDQNNNPVVLPLRTGTLELRQNGIPQANAILKNQVVSIGYSINSNRFVTIRGYENCLLPLNMASFNRLPDTGFIENISYDGATIKAGNYSVEATEFTKPITPFDLGIYPFFKYPNVRPNIATYHIVLSCDISSTTNDSNAVSLQFYTANGQQLKECTRAEYQNQDNGIDSCVIKEVRTNLVEDGTTKRTVHYTVIGANFEYIQVDMEASSRVVSGVLKPKFNNLQQNNNKIKFAVDFGTTSTYVAVREGGNNPTPLTTLEESMVYLHCGEEDNGNRVAKHEKYGGTFPNHRCSAVPPHNNTEKIPSLLKMMKNEFIPSSIDGSGYKFPLRTALSCKKEGALEDIFEDANIAFTYDKESVVGNNEYETNIKWEIDNTAHSSIFIRELVRMCIIHALSKSYTVQNIEFLYFYPLAMDSDTKDTIADVWKQVCDEFGIEEGQVSNMTESLAPYYAAPNLDASCVASIDIGGGSVDTVVYKDGKHQFAMSSLFGGDVLWGNGRNHADNSKTNPILKKLSDTIRDNLTDELKRIHDNMIVDDSKCTSSDIINFWLSNDTCSRVSSYLRRAAYHPVYVAHFYAICYHLAQAMSEKELGAPVEITLSGNGSQYLMYIKQHLSTIAATAFKDVYPEANVSDNIRVTLPKDHNYVGKEMAAYGGLLMPDEDKSQADNVAPYICLGTMSDSQLSSIIDGNKITEEEVICSIASNVEKLQENLYKLLLDLNLLDASEKGWMEDGGAHRTTLLDSLRNASRRYISKNRVVSTLFLAPVQQLIFNIEEKTLKDK